MKIFQLRSQTLVEVILALLGIENGRFVSVVPEMTSGNEAITAYVYKLRRNEMGIGLLPLLPGPHATNIFLPLFGG